MLTAFFRWMRLVLPRGDAILLAIALIASFELIGALVLLLNSKVSPVDLQLARTFFLALTAFVYGIYRVNEFHPLAKPDYRRWLETTPWTWRNPLPGGPVLLVPQDVVVLALLMGLNRDFSFQTLYIPVAFLSFYLANLMAINWLLGEWQLAYSTGFGLGLGGLVFRRPDYLLLIDLACYLLTRIAVQRSFRNFPWDDSHQPCAPIEASKLKGDSANHRLGWPYDSLTPAKLRIGFRLHDAICFAVLLGWWHLTLLWGADERVRFLIIALPLIAYVGIPLLRVFPYFYMHRSPIDVWGRIANSWWVIPKFDCVWIAPLSALMLNFLLLGWASWYEWTVRFRYFEVTLPTDWRYAVSISLAPVGTTAVSLALFLIGPKLEHWRLTGQHRIVFQRSQEFTEL
ncbi:MAG: hypothetical protein JWM11_5924 [Planctomycetaceae bacterium]|nr:hypothetical protein [Planctomycetaceae bacterium]